MKLFNFFFSFFLVFISFSKNINNIILITHSGQDYNLAYIDPDYSGKIVYSNINFAAKNEISELIGTFEEVNYLKTNNQLVSNQNLFLVKTISGSIKLVDVETLILFSNESFLNSVVTINYLKANNKFSHPVGSATQIELASIQRYTYNGGILNTPLRNNGEVFIGPITLPELESQLYQSIVSGLSKLRQTSRLETGIVIRGRTFSLVDYNALFNSGSQNVPLKGFVSCTKNEAVAIDFLSRTSPSISGTKVKVMVVSPIITFNTFSIVICYSPNFRQ